MCAPPIPGNIIPASQLDPVGLNLINLYPLPNQPGTRDFRNNFYRSGKALEDYWAVITRFDHAFSENHRIFLRLHRDFWEEDKNRAFNNDVNGVILNRNNKGIAFDDVYVINASLLFNFRYGLTYQDFPERRVSQGYDLSKLGFSQQLISLIRDEGEGHDSERGGALGSHGAGGVGVGGRRHRLHHQLFRRQLHQDEREPRVAVRPRIPRLPRGAKPLPVHAFAPAQLRRHLHAARTTRPRTRPAAARWPPC